MIKEKLNDYIYDTENPQKNFDLALEYAEAA